MQNQNSMNTRTTPTAGYFPTTDWSLIHKAGDDKTAVNRPALENLLRQYWPAIQSHLIVKRKIKRDRAEDLVQGFITDRVIEKKLVARVERKKGKFRTFLLNALDWYVKSDHRYHTAQKRCAGHTVEVDTLLAAGCDQDTPEHVFEVEWARLLLAQTLQTMQRECHGSGRDQEWGVFECRILRPVLDPAAKPPPYEELVEQFGLQSPTCAANILVTAKRRFARILRSIIGQYTPDPSLIEQEIAELRQILSETGVLYQAVSDTGMTVNRPAALSQVMDLGTDPGVSWSPHELAAVLDHQLSASLASDLKTLPGLAAQDVVTLVQSHDPAVQTFRDLITHPDPSVELLNHVKVFAKDSRDHPDRPLPRQVASIIYYASIAAAQLHGDRRITDLDYQQLEVGLRWAIDQPWINPMLRSLFQRMQRSLGS